MDIRLRFLKLLGRWLDTISPTLLVNFRNGKLLKQVNATILALIPKVQLPSTVSDYRPISCCTVIYKTIAKIIVKRMQLVLHLLIDYSQNAFVPGRNISDNILLAQELLAGYNQARLPPRSTIKVDIQKAYDSVEWDFLIEVLKLFNFPACFIGWIEQCVTTASFSISLMVQSMGIFLVLEDSDRVTHVTISLRSCNGNMDYSYVTEFEMIIISSFTGNARNTVIKDTLAEFANISGLQVNASKSQIIISKSGQHEKQQILDLLGFQEGFYQ
ncbi:UNVERIFIED_CONTAM: hypothetical protein Sangu_3129900 [Sesamum angustifolium]|uniref:Reverse transcriptase domain-containing protein n=1 Tax=Sesamum angustifolium TaxID=2727405 RepID=A0AAW2K006_9LAMI